MLLTVEIDGFKTFSEFHLDTSPLTVVLGRNAAGKSNLFDALHLVSRLAHHDVAEAMRGLRGEPRELFRLRPDGARVIRLAVEALLDDSVTDAFGKAYPLKNTVLRYEIEIGFPEPGRPVVTHERLTRLTKKDPSIRDVNPARLRFRSHKEYLLMSSEGSQPQFVISQDGNQGRNQRRPAIDATATVLSTMRDGTFPHLFAFAEYLRSWQFLHFDPAGLREPSEELAGDRLHPSGRNIAAVLGLLMNDTATPEEPLGMVADISRDLSGLVDGLLGVRPQFDESRRRWELVFETARDGDINARIASDGTLRLLALLTALADPAGAGLICFEEPENGVHPERLGPLMEIMTGAVSDLATPPDGPLRQLLVNSHSPVVLTSVADRPTNRVVFLDRVQRVDRSEVSEVSRARYVPNGTLIGGNADEVGAIEVDRYLSTAAQPAA